MNTYHKFCPNVFVAKTEQEYSKGDVIELTTRRGAIHECEVWNLIFKRDGFNFYSITRRDGFNVQERARRKTERLNVWANNAEKRSEDWIEKSNEGKEFLVLGEPIKIGHHSEKRHRALIERNWNRMGNAVKESDKAKKLRERAEYWENMTDKIDLSLPESLEYFEYKLDQAKKRHEGLKVGRIEREHSFSLTYAKKEVNELGKKVRLAKALWG